MSKLKFAHLADLHLGSLEKKLTDLNFKTFQTTINKIIEEKCDFILFVGDIFNTPIPDLDLVNKFVLEVRKLQLKNIPIYVIGGSHDYSNNHKSFIELLNSTRTLINVGKVKRIDKNKFELIPTKNDKLRICLYGIKGRKNNIEKYIYEHLDKVNLDNNYLNIFLFHSTIDNLKPAEMNFESKITTSLLPLGFDYYAGGHIHKNIISKLNDKPISYSGCLFPNNFKELVDEKPSFNLCEFDFDSRKTKVEPIFLKTYTKEFIPIQINNLNPIETKNKILKEIEQYDVKDKIILLKISGNVDGKIMDIEINKIIEETYNKGAQIILKNTYKLKSNLIEINSVETNESSKEIEKEIIENYLENNNDINIANKLFNLELSKQEDEKVAEYEKRIIELVENQLD